MKPIVSTKIFCPCCNTEHDVSTLNLREKGIFKGTAVEYDAQVQFCQISGETWFTESQLSGNYRSMEAAFKELQKQAQ